MTDYEKGVQDGERLMFEAIRDVALEKAARARKSENRKRAQFVLDLIQEAQRQRAWTKQAAIT